VTNTLATLLYVVISNTFFDLFRNQWAHKVWALKTDFVFRISSSSPTEIINPLNRLRDIPGSGDEAFDTLPNISTSALQIN
jgi:hypothetical protein